MTTGFSIFKDKSTMASVDSDDSDAPVHTRQVARDGKNALSRSPQTENMDVVNCCRPRRGHDY